MKQLFFLILILPVWGNTFGQTTLYFSYEPTEDSTLLLVRPLFKVDTIDEQGKVQPLYQMGENSGYLTTFMNNILKNVLSAEQVNRLYRPIYKTKSPDTRSLVFFGFGMDGNIKNISFLLFKEDLKILTDERLYKYFQELCKRKIDTNIWKLTPPPGKNRDDVFWKFGKSLYNFNF